MTVYCLGQCPIIVCDEETAQLAGVWVEETARAMIEDRPPPRLDTMGITRINGFGEIMDDK